MVEDSGGTIKVAGIGVYVSATDDITRNDTWNYSSGGVVDTNPATNITLSGGSHKIRCDVTGNQLAAVRTDYLNARADSQYIVDAWDMGISTTRSGIANRLWVNAFSVVAPVTLSGLGIDVTTLEGTSVIQIGLYKTDFETNILTLIDKTASIDTSTATGSIGYNTANLSAGNLTLLPNEPLFIVMGSDGAPTTRGFNRIYGGHPYMPMRYDFKGGGQFLNSGWSSGLPATIAAPTHNNVQTGGSFPNCFGVKA